MDSDSKSYYHKSGNAFRVTPKVNLDLHERLPVGTYNVNYDQIGSEYFLETINDFQLKGKIYGKPTFVSKLLTVHSFLLFNYHSCIYSTLLLSTTGNVAKTSSRILNTFLDRPKSTGVLLVGEKGSGKTLLAQYTSIAAAKEKNIPTIVINKPWHGDQFNAFIQSISQPAVILFDEFEKVYLMDDDTNYQEKILTLFDGVYSSQKLFLLTCNDKYRMDSHMMNRPGRLYYLLEFDGLDQDFVIEYCEDNLLNKGFIQAVAATASLFQSFNFDMLKAMVEDMNRYDESPSEVLKFLNIRLDNGGYEKFNVKLIVDGKKVENAQANWSGGSPVSQVIRIHNYEEDKEYVFSSKHLKKLEPKTRVFTFKNEAGEVLILTPAPTPTFAVNYDTLASTALNNSSSVDATFDAVSETDAAMIDSD